MHFCMTPVHTLKHRFNSDEPRRGSTHHVHGSISVLLNKNIKKTTKAQSQPLNTPQVHSSAKQNLSYNLETLHHARAVKSSTVVIFEDNKHIRETLKSLTTIKTPTGFRVLISWWTSKMADILQMAFSNLFYSM